MHGWLGLRLRLRLRGVVAPDALRDNDCALCHAPGAERILHVLWRPLSEPRLPRVRGAWWCRVVCLPTSHPVLLVSAPFVSAALLQVFPFLEPDDGYLVTMLHTLVTECCTGLASYRSWQPRHPRRRLLAAGCSVW